jgi:hypothetical protein
LAQAIPRQERHHGAYDLLPPPRVGPERIINLFLQLRI